MSAASYKAAGNAALAAKDFDAAVEAYSQAIALEPTDPVFFSNRSAAHLSKGDASAALADARSIVAILEAIIGVLLHSLFFFFYLVSSAASLVFGQSK